MRNTSFVPENEIVQEKTLCVFLLDNSGSMSGQKIDDLNKGLQEFYQIISCDGIWAQRIEIAIISFESNVHYIQEPALVDDFTMPSLNAMGGTDMAAGIQKAIEVVEERKKFYRESGISYKCPWIIMMTDGFANVDSIKDKVNEDGKQKRYRFQPIAIDEGADMNVLNSLTTTKSVFMLDDDKRNIISFLRCVSYGMGYYSTNENADGNSIEELLGNPFDYFITD